MGSYTQEALDFLQDELIIKANALIATGAVSEEEYLAFVDVYNQFLQMPKTSISQFLREDCYYYIHNIWFSKYAHYNASSKNIGLASSKSDSDTMLWRIKKNADGTVYIYSKKTETAAYLESNAVDQQVKVGRNYSWTLEERTLDGKEGICIIDGSGTASWYTNPNSWNYILMKPFWGACTWEFVESGIQVPTSITDIDATPNGDNKVYDMSGREVANPQSGIYIINGQKQVIE